MKKVLTSVFNLIISCFALCAGTVSSPGGHLIVSFNLTPNAKPPREDDLHRFRRFQCINHT